MPQSALRNSVSACAAAALGKNWKGLALDTAGWAANIALPEASVPATVAGAVIGAAGIGVAIADNNGPADAAASGAVAYSGKQAAIAEGLMRGAAGQVARRIGFIALTASTLYDLGKTGSAFNDCRNR